MSEEKNNLCILIPTYNRSNAVDYYLENKLNLFRELHFDVVLYDSSKNTLTRDVAEKYIKQGYHCLKYVSYEDLPDDLYGTAKTANALVQCADDYDYVWLCGDQAVLKLEEYQDELLQLLTDGFDVIHVYINKLGRSSEQDINYKDFFKDFFWSMTHFCSFILSGRVIKKMEQWMKKYLEMNCTMAIVFPIFAVLPSETFRIAYINHAAFEPSPCRTLASSAQNKEMLRGYAEAINIGVDNLPEEYNDVKSITKKSFCKNTGHFDWQSAIDLRADGNLILESMKKYGKYLKQMTDVPLSWFYLWSIMPRKIARRHSNFYNVYVEGINKLCEINKKGGRLILYGAGQHGIRILEKIKYSYPEIKVVAVSDKNWSQINREYQSIPPEDIPQYESDYIGIAIVNPRIYKEIKKMLLKLHVPVKKLFHV